MDTQPPRPNMRVILVFFFVLIGAMIACARALQSDDAPAWQVPGQEASQPAPVEATQGSFIPATRPPGVPILTPTPDNPHHLPTLRADPIPYVVQAGDTLGEIAQEHSISLEVLIEANELLNPNLLEINQQLVVPPPIPGRPGPDFKIIPDSELVNGPASAHFDVAAFVQSQGGYLHSYSEEVGEKLLSGAQIIERVARDFSVNPRLLLSVLQYQSGWVTQPDPDEATLEYPIGVRDASREGLYLQITWTANNLNRGYYLWRVNAIATWLLGDGSVVPIAPTINAGTAGVQHLFAPLYERSNWEQAILENGLFATYIALFGYPFDLAVEPILPPGLRQPTLQLPFEAGKAWAFTGGPHGAWGGGSAWAALDFAPPTDALGCIQSEDWVMAAGSGKILRAGDGAVIQDLDHGGVQNDGLEHTGWVLLYMHVESRDRVRPGTHLKAGERIGHPSCEGGVSTGTHVHLARRYNGEWIPADQTLPFILDGWVSRGLGAEYDGYMEREGQKVEAWAGRSPSNAIQR